MEPLKSKSKSFLFWLENFQSFSETFLYLWNFFFCPSYLLHEYFYRKNYAANPVHSSHACTLHFRWNFCFFNRNQLGTWFVQCLGTLQLSWYTSRKIPFRTLLFSAVVLVFVLILPFAFHCASWLIANADWQPIILCFILISIDVLKVPLQLKWKFKENTGTPSNHRRITEDQRIISLQHSSQEKLTSTNV